MKKRQEKRMKMRMGRSRMDMQQNDLQRKKRRWVMALEAEGAKGYFLSSYPFLLHLSLLPPFQPVLALSFSLWLHTISDEEGLEMLSDREEGMGLRVSLPPQVLAFLRCSQI
uniref:Uncharacterized protein n=1 Tax=Gopherus evgoodei TaxID=1825980 RepID=A0A8C4WAQ8_9SAUR